MLERSGRVAFIVGGAGVGAVIRYLVLQACSDPATALVGIGIATATAGFLVGLALGAPSGRVAAFVLGLGSSTASLSVYAFLGVTQRVAASALFLLAVPVVTAVALVLGIVAVGAWSRTTGAPTA